MDVIDSGTIGRREVLWLATIGLGSVMGSMMGSMMKDLEEGVK